MSTHPAKKMPKSPKSTGKEVHVTPSPRKTPKSTEKIQFDWTCFRRAKPEHLPKLTHWMLDTWGKVESDNRRGFHLSKLKEIWRIEFMEVYKHIYRTNSVYNNEVGTVLARAFAAYKHGVKVDWGDFASRRDQKVNHTPYAGGSRKELDLEFCKDSDSVGISIAQKHVHRLSAEAKNILSSWHDNLSSRSAHLLADLQDAEAKVRDAQKEVDSFDGTRKWLSNKLVSLSESSDGQNVMKEAFEKDLLDVDCDLQVAIGRLHRMEAQRELVDKHLKRVRLYGANMELMVESLTQSGVQAVVPLPTAHPITSEKCIKLRIDLCMYCGLGYEQETLDVVVTPCLHTYHFICARIHFYESLHCHASMCGKDVSDEWVNIMGFRTTSVHTATQGSEGVLGKRPVVLPSSPKEVRTIEKPNVGTSIPSSKRSRANVRKVEGGNDTSDDEDKILHRVKRQQHMTKQTKSDGSPPTRKSPRLLGKPIEIVDDEALTESGEMVLSSPKKKVSDGVHENLITPKKRSAVRNLLYNDRKRSQSQSKPQGKVIKEKHVDIVPSDTGDQVDEQSMLEISVPSLSKNETLGSSHKVAGLDEVDSLDEYNMQEDSPEELAASKEPVEQTTVQIDGNPEPRNSSGKAASNEDDEDELDENNIEEDLAEELATSHMVEEPVMQTTVQVIDLIAGVNEPLHSSGKASKIEEAVDTPNVNCDLEELPPNVNCDLEELPVEVMKSMQRNLKLALEKAKMKGSPLADGADGAEDSRNMKKMLDEAFLIVQRMCKDPSLSSEVSGAEQKVDSVQPGGHSMKSAKKVDSGVPGDPSKKVENVVPGGQSAKVESVVPGDPSMKSGIADASGTVKSTAGKVTKSFRGPRSPFVDNTPLADFVKSRKKKKKARKTNDATTSDQKGASSNKVKTRSNMP